MKDSSDTISDRTSDLPIFFQWKIPMTPSGIEPATFRFYVNEKFQWHHLGSNQRPSDFTSMENSNDTISQHALINYYLARDLHSFGILRSVEWQFLTDVSGQPNGSFLKYQGFTLKMGQIIYPETSTRNCYSTPVKYQKKQIPFTYRVTLGSCMESRKLYFIFRLRKAHSCKSDACSRLWSPIY